VLARVIVVAQRTRESSRSVDQFIDMFDGRIQSMANAHALLSRGRWNGVHLAELVRQELEPYLGTCEARVDGPNVLLPAEATQALAMVLHELATNAAKYGALSTPGGCVHVDWGCESDGNSHTMLTIRWRETGGPPVRVPARRGYGTSVISDLIPYELSGLVNFDYEADGVRCLIELPLEQATGDLPAHNRSTALTAARNPAAASAGPQAVPSF
jgi:two-component sensor histidine kinase